MNRLFFFVFTILCFQTISYAKFATPNLEDVVQQSEIVVIGSLENVSTYTQNCDEINQGTLTVDEVIWGDVSVGQKLFFEWFNSTMIACRVGHTQNKKSIWLLKSSDKGVTPVFGGQVELDKRADVEKLLLQNPISLINNSLYVVSFEEPFDATLILKNPTNETKVFPGIEYKDNYLYLSPDVKFEVIAEIGDYRKIIKPKSTRIIVSRSVSPIELQPNQEFRIKLDLKSIFQLKSKLEQEYSFKFKAKGFTNSNNVSYFSQQGKPVFSCGEDKVEQKAPSEIYLQTNSEIDDVVFVDSVKTKSFSFTPLLRAFIVFDIALLLFFLLYKRRVNY